MRAVRLHRFLPIVVAMALGVASAALAAGENIDPNGDDHQYAWSENFGWINAEPLGNAGPGVEVSDFSDLPREFQSVRIPEQRYAVFTHSEHISTIRRTVNTIWNHWLPISGFKAADAPNFERYDEKFDPATGNGGLEIWIPVRE